MHKSLKFLVYSLSFIVIFSGCAKETTTSVQTTSNATSQDAIASDEVTLNNEFDLAADDAITVLCNHKASIAGALVDTSQLNVGVIEIDYFGKAADGTKSRTGADSIHLNMVSGHPVNWATAGISATITMGTINSPGYEVTFISNNTSMRINGTATLTNISGGLLQNVSPTDSLVEILRGAMSYTFNDNTATIVYYAFNLNQVRTFWQIPPTWFTVETTRGDTTINGINGVSNWGTDRFGDTYYTAITANVVQNISFVGLSYNPLSGAKVIEDISEPITCTFGVNQQGTVITSGTPYGFIITWINGGGQAQSVIPYYY